MSNDRTLRPLPGRHAAVCRHVQIADGSTAAQVVIGFELIDPSPEAGLFTSYFGHLGDKAIDHTVKALRTCGWRGDDLSELPALAEADQLAEVVELVIAHETFEGKQRVKVKWVNPPGGGKIKLDRVIEGSALADFGARMRSRIAAAGGGSGSGGGKSPPARQPSDDIPPPSDQDIPF